MARNYSSGVYQPDKDAGWGLIFRLNDLWRRVDERALNGNYDGWELVLDRIFSNLLYREPVEVERNNDEQIINVKFSKDDIQEWSIMKKKIKMAKVKKTISLRKKNRRDYIQSNENHYLSLMYYDVWLRKFMQRHQLYLRETESNPGQALFGGAFSK